MHSGNFNKIFELERVLNKSKGKPKNSQRGKEGEGTYTSDNISIDDGDAMRLEVIGNGALSRGDSTG